MSRLLAADGPKSGFGAIGHVLPSEGPVTELKAGVLRRHGERLKMPQSGLRLVGRICLDHPPSEENRA